MKMDIEKVARLARLELSEEEKETFGNQLEQILTYMEQLNRLDTSRHGTYFPCYSYLQCLSRG